MAATNRSEALRWFGVRCIFRLGDAMYEERITVWRAHDFDHAIRLAEDEAARYAAAILDAAAPTTYIGLAQAYEMDAEPGAAGAEVFSLIRDSDLAPDAYLDRYFDSGDEHEDGL